MKTIKLMAVALTLALLSCSKGDTGPAGAAGTNGTNGSANVTSSSVLVNSGDWSASSGYYYQSFSVPAITDASKDEVDITVSESSGTYIGLPVNNVLAGGDEITFQYSNGNVIVYYLYSAPPSVSLSFKITVIPPA